MIEMSKTALIALLIVLVAGGGIVFAQSNLGSALLGSEQSPPEIEEPEEGSRDFGEEVSDLAREDEPEVVPAGNSENGNEEEGRSPVAEAVLKVLGGEGGKTPEDGEAFGEAVSEQAREDGRALGEAVSGAARDAAGSAGQAGR